MYRSELKISLSHSIKMQENVILQKLLKQCMHSNEVYENECPI
jgi:hypothetical protein